MEDEKFHSRYNKDRVESKCALKQWNSGVNLFPRQVLKGNGTMDELHRGVGETVKRSVKVARIIRRGRRRVKGYII